MVPHALHQRIESGAIAADVFDRAVVAVEDRQQLHRQHGGRTAERFDNPFVRHGGTRHPREIGQAAFDGRLAVAGERHVGHGEIQSAFEVEEPDASGARQSGRRAREPRARGAAITQ
jgi:hypothetical protein